MDDDAFLETFLNLAAEHGIGLSHEQAVKCLEHIRLMLEWNRRLNLTRITDHREIIIEHLLDSIIPSKRLPRKGFALDLGSGAGFPGAPLKIVHPELDICLLDSQRKKVSYLKALIARLELNGIVAVQGRWEEILKGGQLWAERRCTLMTMRAVRLEAAHLTSLASQVLEPGGIFAWWAGPDTNELHGINKKAEWAGMISQEPFSYILPGSYKPRRVLLWKKMGRG